MTNLDHMYEIDERFKAFENHKEGLLVSLAGPGTGKTYSLLRRVAYLVDQLNLNLDSICYLTFINEISNTFRSDYKEEFEQSDKIIEYPRISTLHSFACRIIRNRGFTIGYDGELFFTSVAPDPNTFESKTFINDLINAINNTNLNSVAKVRNSLCKIKKVWRDQQDPNNLSNLELITLHQYLDLARAYRLVDWDQTIPIALDLYQNPGNRQTWLTHIQHFLIDEYQDFNKSEQSFILKLSSDVSSTIIVGDDNQSLYRSRGGTPEALRLLNESEEVDQISLVRCRRCKEKIVDHANQLLKKMCNNPRLMLPNQTGGYVNSYKFKSTKSEIVFLEDYLNERIKNLPENPRPKDGIVCLFPTRKSLGFYYEKLNHLLPCYTDRTEIVEKRKRIINCLNLYTRPQQRFFERLLLEYFPEIKPRHKILIMHKILEMDISPTEACYFLIIENAFTGKAVHSIESFLALSQALSSRDIMTIVSLLTEWTEVEEDALVEQFTRLVNSLEEKDQEEAISVFCNAVLPSTSIPEENLKSILFLTMHGAKGLTKNTVVMPGLEDAWLPGSATGELLEERRRLFYVSLTRATDRVLITHPINRAHGEILNFSCPGRSEVSRFTNESGIITRYHE